MNAAQRYTRTQTETASRERLMVLLFETALRHMRAGIGQLEHGDTRAAATSFAKASDIVVELYATLDRRQAADLCDRLAELYIFVCARLTRAATGGDITAAQEAERVFAPLGEAFAQAVAELGRGGQR